MKSGAQQIVEERQRQITEEGFTRSMDQAYKLGELIGAAICYAWEGLPDVFLGPSRCPVPWPWDPKWDKRSRLGAVSCLVKAGALIAAEIDRRLIDGGHTIEDETDTELKLLKKRNASLVEVIEALDNWDLHWDSIVSDEEALAAIREATDLLTEL